MEKNQETIKWAAERFGIPESEVLWYHSGICYDRIGVTTLEAAMKVHQKVEGETVNGGMFDGMPLGSHSKYKTDDGKEYFDVQC